MKRDSRFSRIHKIMKTRCQNPNYQQYNLWGGRGIKVCQKWQSLPGFIDDMYDTYKSHVATFGEKDTQLDRINPDGDYEPSNCRWASRIEQSRNRRNVKRYEYNGELLTIPEISVASGIPAPTLYDRVYNNNALLVRHKPGPQPAVPHH